MTDAGSILVLIVEDEPQLRRFIRASLTSHGYRLLEGASIADAELLARTHHPDLILLDLTLPDGDGIDFTKALRKTENCPIIVISARGREDDKVAALDAGADDYLTKPFGVSELLARMRVAMRHREGGRPRDGKLTFDDLSVDLDSRIVTLDGREVHLTPTEYKLLVLLARNAGRVLTHGQILREVWGSAYEAQSHYVRVHMAELRKKIERDPARPKLVVTEPGVGYRFQGAPKGS